LQHDEGCARLVRCLMQMLRVGGFWVFCVDAQQRALAWQTRALDSRKGHPEGAHAFTVRTSLDSRAAEEWMLKLAASCDRASRQAVHVDSSTVAAPGGFWDAWVVRPAANGGTICVGCAGQSHEQPWQPDVAALADAGMLLDEVFALRNHIRSDRQQSMGLAAMADRANLGVVLLDENAGIRFANQAARAMLAARDGLIDQSGRLAGLRARENTLLGGLLRSGRAGAINVAEIERRSGARSYGVIHVAAVTSDGGPPTHGILVNDPEQPVSVSATRVQRLFGLTAAESVIAARYATGSTTADIAREFRISRLTLKTHLRSIFRKTGARRQTELAILILRSVAAAVTDAVTDLPQEDASPVAIARRARDRKGHA
jgi:DNA-binding CsgD family transcriptional regulator